MAHLSFTSTTKLAELIDAADPQRTMQVRILNANQLALGTDPLNPTKIIDLSNETVRSISSENSVEEGPTSAPAPVSRGPTTRVSRQSGKYLLDMKGQTTECRSLKELLSTGLKALEKSHPGTLDKLSQIKPRTKRIVARNADSLFDQPELVENYAEELVNGWWFGTNNSADETITWLRRGAEIAGLAWGKDFSTSL
jgi:hypothetical protein